MMDKKKKNILIQLLNEFDRICKQCNLKYFLIGGSALGAVRHKGLIPWDDDIDVGMPRADYEKFKSLPNTIFNTGFELRTENNKNYYHRYIKLEKTDTTLVEKEYPFYIGGTFLDIFPFDGVSSNKEEQIKQYNLYQKYNSRLARLNRPVSFQKNILMKSISYIFHHIYKRKDAIKKCEEVAAKYDFYQSEYVTSFHSHYGMKEIVKREYFDEIVLLEFEDGKFPLPYKYHEYLSNLFGEYLILPPPEKRITHHFVYFESLEKRYTKKEILLEKKKS